LLRKETQIVRAATSSRKTTSPCQGKDGENSESTGRFSRCESSLLPAGIEKLNFLWKKMFFDIKSVRYYFL